MSTYLVIYTASECELHLKTFKTLKTLFMRTHLFPSEKEKTNEHHLYKKATITLILDIQLREDTH